MMKLGPKLSLLVGSDLGRTTSTCCSCPQQPPTDNLGRFPNSSNNPVAGFLS